MRDPFNDMFRKEWRDRRGFWANVGDKEYWRDTWRAAKGIVGIWVLIAAVALLLCGLEYLICPSCAERNRFWPDNGDALELNHEAH
jgi:hypothetical protein